MYSSPNITRLIKEMCGAWHVWGKEEVPTGFWWETWGKKTTWKTLEYMGG